MRIVILGFLLAISIFVIDLTIPLGVAGGVPYIAVVLLGMWFSGRGFTISAAITASILTLLGFFYSPSGGVMWQVIFNRFLALFTICVTACLILFR